MRVREGATTIYRSLQVGLEPRADPPLYIVEGIFDGVGILSRRSFADLARPNPVRGAFDDDIFFVGTRRNLVVQFVIAQKIMAAHAKNEDRYSDLLKVAWGRIIVGAIVDVIQSMLGANGARAEKRLDRQKLGALVKRFRALGI